MKRLLTAALLLVLLWASTAAPVAAHHGMIGAGMECGTHEWHGEQDLTKGRTDGLIYHVDHRVGCARVILSNLSPAGIGESQGNQGQMDRAQRYGKEDAARTFDYVFHLKVSPDDIKVTTTNWTGRD